MMGQLARNVLDTKSTAYQVFFIIILISAIVTAY
jgi:hypothetical protein